MHVLDVYFVLDAFLRHRRSDLKHHWVFFPAHIYLFFLTIHVEEYPGHNKSYFVEPGVNSLRQACKLSSGT